MGHTCAVFKHTGREQKKSSNGSILKRYACVHVRPELVRHVFPVEDIGVRDLNDLSCFQKLA